MEQITIKNFICILFILCTTAKLQAQNLQFDTRRSCLDFHKYFCAFEEKLPGFTYNTQSRSTLFQQGETSEMYFIAYKGFEYRLKFCGQEKLLEGQKIVFKIKDGQTKELIYNNAKHNFQQEFKFTCTSSARFLIEVSISADKTSKTKSENQSEYNGCVGVLIESRKAKN